MSEFDLSTPDGWERRANEVDSDLSEQWLPGYEAFGSALALGVVITEHGDRLKRDRTEQGENDD